MSVVASAMTCVAVLAGCSDSPTAGKSKRPPSVPASGVIKYNGQPLANATITFSPVDATKRWTGFGMSDATGRFVLMSTPPKPGVPEGEYGVKVTKTAAKTASPAKPAPTGAFAHEAELFAASEGAEAAKSELPEKYASAETSGIRVVIPKAGKTDLVIELTD